jgi:heat-inducible transcriptional repressor
VKSVVSALDAREQILRLLDATMEAKGVTVVVGREAGEVGHGQLAIVGASYVDDGRTIGSVGVIGPTRMDYPKVVPIVTATASAMSEYMRRTRSPSRKRDDDK